MVVDQGWLNYNSLQIAPQRVWSRGFQMGIAYTAREGRRHARLGLHDGRVGGDAACAPATTDRRSRLTRARSAVT